MTQVTQYLPGAFCWVDLGTPDVAAAKKFYASVLGWKSEPKPGGPPDNPYFKQLLDGHEISAIYRMVKMSVKKKQVPFLLPYIAVESVDRTIKKVVAAGGTLHLGPHDVPGSGRMAIFGDPAGAAFAIWEAQGNIGTEMAETPGTVCWHDLNTPDQKTSAQFYAKVFGWKMVTQEFSGNDYYLFKVAGKAEGLGGMWPQPMKKYPPTWFTYFVVKNCARSVTKATKLGGKALLGPITVPETCTFSIIQDPQGAAFGVLEPLG
jgi:predicted enzyme related to lactoylglutathione lyase